MPGEDDGCGRMWRKLLTKWNFYSVTFFFLSTAGAPNMFSKFVFRSLGVVGGIKWRDQRNVNTHIWFHSDQWLGGNVRTQPTEVRPLVRTRLYIE